MGTNRFEISEEKRRKLSDCLKQAMYREDINLSMIAVETDMNLADIHKILGAEKRKINPTHLRLLAKALKLETLELFYIVGYIEQPEWEAYKAEKKVANIKEYPAQRNLDGIFFRVARNGVHKNVAFTDLLEEEQNEQLDNMTDRSMRNMVKILAVNMRELGDRFNLIRVAEDVKE